MDPFKNQQMNQMKKADADYLNENARIDNPKEYIRRSQKSKIWLYVVLAILILMFLSFIF